MKYSTTIAPFIVVCLALAACEQSTTPTLEQAETEIGFKTQYIAIAKGFVDVEGGIIHLAAQRDGVIDQVYVEEGDKVEANQILATQNTREAELQKQQAQIEITQNEADIPLLTIQLKAAKREVERITRLVEERAASRQALDALQDQVKLLNAQIVAKKAVIETAKARLAITEHEIALRSIRAPMKGSIVRRFAQPGMGLSTLNVSTLFWFVPDTPHIVRAEVEERFISDIRTDMPSIILPENNESLCYSASVKRIGLIFGPKRSSSYDPEERADVRVVEVVLGFEGKVPLLLGQRVIVKFVKVPYN